MVKKRLLQFAIVAAFTTALYLYSSHDSKRSMAKYAFTQEYNGVVTGKFIDSNDRDVPKVILDDHSILPLYNIDIFDTLLPGDRLVKADSTLQHFLVKSTGDTILYYQRSNEKDVKELIP